MDLLSRLKEKRKEISEREGKELFMVFQNKVLEATARALPKTKADLAAIKGWGKKKIEKYGDEFLTLINGNARRASNTPGLFDIEPTSAEASADRPAPPPRPTETSGGVVHVSQFLQMVNRTLGSLGACRVRGELGRVEYRQGNCYFRLKDATGADSTVDCFMWRWDAEAASHLLEDGLEVMVEGGPNVYKTGRFSINVKTVRPVGEGALKKAFEALKRKLEAAGYFDPARKRPIPRYVRAIALITSSQGEAINDFRKNIGEYGFRITLLDVRVEGEYAEESVVRALHAANRLTPMPDVIALVRGGGSAESLHVFNSEKIADAILTSRVPVITGIGHERDETIADYVADLRASTPTAAAAYVRNAREELLRAVHDAAYVMVHAVQNRLEAERHRIVRRNAALELGLRKAFERFRVLVGKLHRACLAHTYALERTRHEALLRLHTLFETCTRGLTEHAARLTSYEEALRALNPEAVLARGYGIVSLPSGHIVKSAAELSSGTEVRITLHKGALDAEVKRVIQ